jgi:hypothetical protein
VQRGVRARVAGGEPGVECDGPPVGADELAFRAVGGPCGGPDGAAGWRLGGQRAGVAERRVQGRKLARGEGDPVDVEGPARPRNWAIAASRCSARAIGAGSLQTETGNRSTTVVGLLVAAGK